MRVWDEQKDFKSLILNDPDITQYLSEGEIETCFDVKAKLRYVDTVFERVFGKG